MRSTKYTLLLWIAISVAFLGCLPEKEVEIKLPDYERQLVVECYMEPGKPFRMLLMESVGFNDGLDTPLVENALIIVSHNGIRDTLHESFSFEPIGFKIFNYNSNNVVPVDYSTEYELLVRSLDGREVTAKAKVQAPVTIDALNLEFNQDSLASLTIRWQDIPGMANFYRCSLHRGTLYSGDPAYEGGLEFDFTVDDRIGDGEMFTIGTFFDFKHGDTLIASVAQIDEPYWRYLNSVSDAASSNGNPFAQPGIIQSTVTGGIGVFTGFQIARDTIIVP